MEFVNIFKYKINIAKITEIVYRHEHKIILREYEPPHDPFGSNILDYDKYDKGSGYGDHYRETNTYIFDYKLIVEFKYHNIIYQKAIVLNNSLRFLKSGNRIIIYFERKNPNNVYPF